MRLRGARLALVALALMLLTAATGCRAGRNAGSAPSGTSTHTIKVEGQNRSFRLYRPAVLDPNKPAALVVMLHGGFGSAKQAESAYGWDQKADAEHFLVAYPDGIDRAWAVGGGCCGVPGSKGVDDVAFIVAMVNAIRTVDPNRIYATGISNGGLMAYRLACDTDVFAAIGPDAATMLGDCPQPAPTSIIHLHGSADRNIPYDGSPGDGVAHIDGPSVPDVITGWRTVDRCQPARNRETTSVADCADGRTVELVVFVGAGHQWLPGATDTIWEFFAGHVRSGHGASLQPSVGRSAGRPLLTHDIGTGRY